MVIKVASGEFDHCDLVTLTTAEFERFTSIVVSDTDVLYYFFRGQWDQRSGRFMTGDI